MTKIKGSSRVNMPYLPDDLLLNCLAHVARSHYPILSLVSKRFRSLVASLELYPTRTLLGCTESCLYVWLSFSCGSNPRWFTLCRRPTRTPNPKPNPKPNRRWFTPPCFRPTNCTRKEEKKFFQEEEEKKLSNNLMVSVPTSNFSPSSWSTHAAIGSNIYMIGEKIDGASRVFFMDCRSHTWHEAPSMQIARKLPLVSVRDGKIYVVEGSNSRGSSDLMEIFDPKTQIWKQVPSPRAEILGQSSMLRSVAIDGKLYLYGDKSVVYNPKDNKWDVVGFDTRFGLGPVGSFCLINNVIYNSKFCRMLTWYDSEGRSWRFLKGLEELPEIPHDTSRVRIVNYGGKISVLWEEGTRDIGSDEKMIWCAVIAVEKRNGKEVYGKIEWCDAVLTVPMSCRLLEFTAVTV